jgi:RPA family protein
MSGSEDQGGAGRREVAYRLFAAEFDDADFSYSESDEERAPNYVVSPTGGRVNRLFVVGVLTEVENASEDVLRARIVDPTGAFVVYAGQYQPEAQAFFDQAQAPMFVAVTGKARTFQPDDSEVTYTSIRPENVNEVDAETRDRWTVGTARQTLDRVRTMAGALQRQERGDELRAALDDGGVDSGLAAGIPLAIDHYGTTPAYLDAVRHTAVQALEVVAGEREEVDPHAASPDAPGDVDPATLAALDVTASVGGETTDLGGTDDQVTASGDTGTSSTATTTADTDGSETTADGAATADGSTESVTEAESGATEPAESASAESVESSEPESDTEPTDPSPAETEPGTAAAADPDAEATESTSGDTAAVETEPVGAPAEGGTETGAPDAGADSPDAGADAADGDDLDDFDPGEFELDDEEREEIEEEYGTGFTSGNEVDEPGEADIDTPDPEELAEAEAAAEADEPDTAAAESEPATTEASESEPSGADTEATTESEPESADAEPAEDVDIEDAVMDAMAEHDDGDGAHADEIVETVTDRTGADGAEVRDAIQDALMGGHCYEPEDDVYKPI